MVASSLVTVLPAVPVERAWRKITHSAFLGLFSLILTSGPAYSQQEILSEPELPSEEETAKTHRHLQLIAKRTLVIQEEIDELLQKPPSKENTEQLQELQDQLDRLNRDFEAMATHLPLEEFEARDKRKSDWLKQLEELTLPLLQAIRDLTEKPRRIDNLKKRIETLEERHQRYQEASRHLAVLIEETEEAPLPMSQEQEKYFAHIKRLKNKYDPELVKLNLEKARDNLATLLESEESMVDSVTRSIKDFFKNRGRNLLVTIGTFAGLWWILIRLRHWLTRRRFLAKLSPALHKLFSAAYNVFVLFFCLLASLACLYFFNDWLLISLIAMALILVAWTSRQWIPKFLQEIKLIVNLGTVREGERMIWQGVPWLVDSIGLQATLVNERLEGGEIKMPVHELLGKHSRPVVENETWFPTEPKDWVILADGTYGRVENQTLEQVVLQLKGGALKYYPTSEFLSKTPVNISQGFRYSIEFGLDYGVQSRVCDDIPTLFDEGLRKYLKSHFEGDPPDFTYLEVSFDHAGSSALNLMILVHADGRCAEFYEEYQRQIQSALVRICNENGLVIPFNRLTINLAGETGRQAPPAPETQVTPSEGRV